MARRRLQIPTFFGVLAGAALVLWFVYAHWFLPLSPEAYKAADDEALRKQQIALAKDDLQIRLQEGSEVLRDVDKLKDDATRWKAEIEPLLTSERGMALTSERRFVEQSKAIFAEEHATPSDVGAYQERIDGLLEPIRAAFKDSNTAYKPDDRLVGRINEAKRWVRDNRDRFSADITGIQSQLAEAERLGGKPTGETLRAAIEQLDQRIAFEESESQRKETQAQEDRRRALQATVSQQEASGEATRTTEAAEVRELERMANDINVQRKYLPFLANGMWNGANAGSNWNSSWKVPSPLSYNAIQENGALSDPNVFIEMAVGDIDHNRYPNDRPKWPPPRTREEVNQYVEKWKVFVKLAPIWLRQGKLQP